MPLATALIARLRSQFNHAFTVLIVMSGRFKSIDYYLNRPKIKLSLAKKDCKVLSTLAPDPRDSRPPPGLNISGYASALIHDHFKFVRFVSI